MRCRRLPSSAKPAKLLHRLWCASCRAAHPTDALIAHDLKRMKAEQPSAEKMSRAFAALGLRPAHRYTHGSRGTRRKRWGRRLAMAFTVFGCMVVGWAQYASIMPRVTIPTPALPSPNAYDFFSKAGRMLQYDDAISRAVTNTPERMQRLPQPAPTGVQQTAANRPLTLKDFEKKNIEQWRNRAFTTPEKELLLRANADALTQLRAGFHYPYHEPPARSYRHLFPHYATYRSLARLLALEAQAHAERGDWSAALNSSLDALQMGAMFQKGGVLIGKLVGIACEAIGRSGAWKTVDHLSAGEARQAARQLEKILALHVPIADTYQEEKWLTQASLMEMFRDFSWRATGIELFQMSSEQRPDFMERLGYQAIMLRFTKREIMANVSGYYDQVIANARYPFAYKTKPPEMPRDPLSHILLPVFEQARFQDTSSQAPNALLLVRLALRAYRLERGAYPKSLDALVPGYLSQVPADPFALEGALRYRPLRQGRDYLLYSVGPDGADNQGSPIVNPDQKEDSRRRHMAQPDSRGDIVLGVNTF